MAGLGAAAGTVFFNSTKFPTFERCSSFACPRMCAIGPTVHSSAISESTITQFSMTSTLRPMFEFVIRVPDRIVQPSPITLRPSTVAFGWTTYRGRSNLFADVNVFRVDEGDAVIEHQLRNGPAAEQTFEVGQLQAIVDALDLERIVVTEYSYVLAGSAEDPRNVR